MDGSQIAGTGLPASVRHALRRRTRAEHEATEAAFAPFDIVDPAHYRAFLTAHAMALPRFELGVTAMGWDGWQPRLPYLADDLAGVGARLPAPMAAPRISAAAAWGVQYVLEGSRLGGRLLSERLTRGQPRRYLSPAPDMALRWQKFCAALESACHAQILDEVVDAAIETFRAFRCCADSMAEELH